jgi:hypothetical protein
VSRTRTVFPFTETETPLMNRYQWQLISSVLAKITTQPQPVQPWKQATACKSQAVATVTQREVDINRDRDVQYTLTQETPLTYILALSSSCGLCPCLQFRTPESKITLPQRESADSNSTLDHSGHAAGTVIVSLDRNPTERGAP